MKRENMLKRTKRRLGANGPGLTVAVIAMLVALTGGAFAASGALTSKQKKEVKAIVKKEAKTVAGPIGPAGAQGPTGSAGAKGDKGDKGASGDNGKSVVIGSAPTACGTAGGKTVEVEGAPTTKKDICNGKDGSPWTAGGTLPPGATETGVWYYTGTEADTAGIRVPISFPIKLSKEIGAAHVHFNPPAASPLCPGNFENPGAAPGELCVFVNNLDEFPSFEGIFPFSGAGAEQGASVVGAVLAIAAPGVGEKVASGGTFAVTGCADAGQPNACP